MSQLTLPGFSRRRRNLSAEAAIPCATTHTPQASHLTDDRYREPTFDDLIAGNNREPSHADLLVDDGEDDEDQALKPAARELPIVYPGVSAEALAWLRAQDLPYTPNVRNEHAFDVNHLVPGKPLRRVVDLTRISTSETPPAMPAAGSPRLLFDALDALDRLPALYAVDTVAAEFAASIAAIQTYTALRPDLLHKTPALMTLVPLVALMKAVDAELQAAPSTDHAARLAEVHVGVGVDTVQTNAEADNDFLDVLRFRGAIQRDDLDEMCGELIDELGDVRSVFDAEADDIELLALEAGLPMSQDDEQDGADGIESLADWERELLALPEGEPDPAAERAFADMDTTSDAVDAWYAKQPTASIARGLRVVDNATGAAGTVVKITLDRALVRLDRAPEGLTPFSFFALSPEPAPDAESEV